MSHSADLLSSPDPGNQATPAQASLLYPIVSIVERLPLATLFPQAQPLEVELGCGDGTFLVQYAKAHPERNFLGIERLLGRVRKCDRKALRAKLTNVRLLRIEAGYALEFLVSPAAVTALHVYFPDPWPKRRHHSRRLVNEHFLATASQALIPGGVVYFRTDDPDYFAQITRLAEANSDFGRVNTPAAVQAQITDFERGFLARGMPVMRAAYQRVH